jgi:hypothetical protein
MTRQTSAPVIVEADCWERPIAVSGAGVVACKAVNAGRGNRNAAAWGKVVMAILLLPKRASPCQ